MRMKSAKMMVRVAAASVEGGARLEFVREGNKCNM